MFITFDGIDGAGKSTQIAKFVEYLTDRRVDFVTCRDPGTTAAGEAIRELILHRQEIDVAMPTEMLLYMAARAQLMEEIVWQSLRNGQTVVCDRFVLASLVYQGHGGELPPEQIQLIGNIVTQETKPDFTILLDIPVAIAQKRIGASKDRLESRSTDYFEKVRQGFLNEVANSCHAYVVIDATQTAEEMHTQIIHAYEALEN